MVFFLCAPDHLEGTAAKFLISDLNLHEVDPTGLLEKFQSIVIIEDFDCVCQSQEFFRATFAPCFPLLRLCCACLSQICKRFLILGLCFHCVLEVVLQRCNLDAKLANTHKLFLNGCSQSSYLFLLCGYQCLVFFDGLFLSCEGFSHIFLHLVPQLLHDTHDLFSSWC